MATAPPSLGPPTCNLFNSSDGKVSDASLDIDAFLDSMLMRDPISLGTELVPSILAQGLGLAIDGLFGQQGSNDRKVGSGARPLPLAPRPGAATPTNGLGVSGSVPQSAARKAPGAGPEGPSDTPGAGDPGDPEMDMAAQKQAAAAGAAAAQAAYAHQQQQAATAAAMAAQVYSHQQAAYAQQTQQAAAAAAAVHPAASHRAYMQQAQQAQQAQAQHAAYMQAYQQQAAAYAAAAGQYPPGGSQMWGAPGYGSYGGYGGQSYYTPQQYMQYSAQYGSAMPSNATAQQAAAPAPSAPPPLKAEPRPVPAGTGAEGAGEGVGEDEEEDVQALKRPRLIWTPQLHRRFLESVDRCGGLDHALPKSILKEMGMIDLTRENVASHLQKYRMKLKRDEEEAAVAGVDGVADGEAASPAAEERDGKRRKKGCGSSREVTPAVNNAEGDGEGGAEGGASRRPRRIVVAANVANNSAGEA